MSISLPTSTFSIIGLSSATAAIMTLAEERTSVLILFPYDPSSPRAIDSEFAAEYEAARTIGFGTAFYCHEELEAGNVKDALKRVPEVSQHQELILRGWMVSGGVYARFYRMLLARGFQPKTNPAAYEEAHYLPLAYPHIEQFTARSAWITGDDPEAAWKLYREFAEKDCIIKDWVKSAKSIWKQGCYIPAKTGEKRFRQMYNAFRAERGKLFNRGVVLREYMPIVERGSDVRGLPVVQETRLFFWQGELLVRPADRSPNPLDQAPTWIEVAKRFQSPFITIDVAYLTDGTWKIVEVGDGGVSGLPIGLDPQLFYASLWNKVHSVHQDEQPTTE